jgi:hypothetical protein
MTTYKKFDRVRFKNAGVEGSVVEVKGDSVMVALDDVDETSEFFPHEIELIMPEIDLYYQAGIPFLVVDRVRVQNGDEFVSRKWTINLEECKILEFGEEKGGYGYFDYENRKSWSRALVLVDRDSLAAIFAVYYRSRESAKKSGLTGKSVIRNPTESEQEEANTPLNEQPTQPNE